MKKRIENNKIKTFDQVKTDEVAKTMKYYSIKPRIQTRNNKPNILLRELPEKLIELVKKEKASEISKENVKFSDSTVLKNYNTEETKQVKTISFEVNRFDEALHKEYCRYRKLDMELDTEEIEGEGSNTPSLWDVNMSPNVIGSDETGKSEMFKPMVVAAAYIKDEDILDKCIQLGVYDSKAIGKKVNVIGKVFTGIESWEDKLIQDCLYRKEIINGEIIKHEAKVLVNDFLAIRIITNEELNDKCREKYQGQEVVIDGVEDELLQEAHREVLCALYEKYPKSIVVIDDYTDGNRIEEVKSDLSNHGILKNNIYLTTKGDAKITAVGLASDVSYYISDLGIKYAEKKLNEYTVVEGEMKLLTGSPSKKTVEDFLKKIKEEKKEELLDKFTKRYYKNVKNAL